MIIRSRSNAAIMNNYAEIERDSSSISTRAITKGSTICRQYYLLIGIVLAGVFVYITLLISGPPALDEHKMASNSFEQLTIVMNTFERHDMLIDALDYYSQCEVVKYIYVVWSEKVPPPTKLIAKFADKVHPKITFNIQEKDSLNNRFKPLEGPHLDAVLSVDDDMRIPCEDLNLAFEVWRSSPRSIVGFMPRIHLRQPDGKLVYRCWWRVWWHGVYSIILTKAAIMHHDFFAMYTHTMPQSVRDLVDSKRNCEDIAMQFLIANATALPPIFVKGHLDDKGALNGISTSQNVAKAQHMTARSDCLNELEVIFQGLPLVTSHIMVDSASSGWTNAPSTWFEYLSSDLWKF